MVIVRHTLPIFKILLGATIANSVSEIPSGSHVAYLTSLSPILFDGISNDTLEDIFKCKLIYK